MKKRTTITGHLEQEVQRLKKKLVETNEEQLKLFDQEKRDGDKQFMRELKELESVEGSWPWGSWQDKDNGGKE